MRIERGDWSFVALPGADLRQVSFTGVRLREADLSRVRLDDATLRDCDASGASWHSANVIGCDLRGSDLSTLDPGYASCRARRSPSTRPCSSPRPWASTSARTPTDRSPQQVHRAAGPS